MRGLTRKAGLAAAVLGLFLASITSLTSASAHDPDSPQGKEDFRRHMADHQPAWRDAPITGAIVPCVAGKAGNYPCRNIDLLSVLPLSSIGGGNGNSMWGWTDPSTQKEYAIVGRSNGTAFVDVTDPVNPRYLGNLPSHNGTSSAWRDIKVYANHAYVGADSISTHGMQVFDLTRLRTVTTPQTFTTDAHYTGFGNSHTLSVNTDTGFIYAVGSNTCSGGVHMVNVQNPKSPVNAGCVSSDGYVHENQCVVYHGPDTTYANHEICFNYNEDTLTIVDVTTKSAPRQLSRTGYPTSGYTHQGWLTGDHARLLMDDELDSDTAGTGTYIWDVSNLDQPVNTGIYRSARTVATDHNQYIIGNYSYQANYRAGLTILDITGIAGNSLSEVAYFDIYPADDNKGFNGAWNNYPFFASGIVAISGIEQGLVLVKPDLTPDPPGPFFQNTTDVTIPDKTTVTSSIAVSGVTTVSTVQIAVDIKHTYRGDLVISLIAPDGTVYLLEDFPNNDSADNVLKTYPVNLSAEAPNGTWKLQVKDTSRQDTGRIDSWSMQF
ncbi:choice-of-anchor B family protein [Longispora albida]|uniref:choice-of-anchor B family protein n=1 Tax=Longispora albida TaxID=203523 RepID=UPI00037AA322|nr:choice-of-anchor B family protein [Longispora albida]